MTNTQTAQFCNHYLKQIEGRTGDSGHIESTDSPQLGGIGLGNMNSVTSRYLIPASVNARKSVVCVGVKEAKTGRKRKRRGRRKKKRSRSVKNFLSGAGRRKINRKRKRKRFSKRFQFGGRRNRRVYNGMGKSSKTKKYKRCKVGISRDNF